MSSAKFPEGWPSESDWSDRLQSLFAAPFFGALQHFVQQKRLAHTIYPPPADVFNAFRHASLAETKVVILGQDPYHGPGQAHGLSFSVAGQVKRPPSLQNIFKELAADLNAPLAKTGNLTSWAEQGVLLLNTVLTVRAAEANSHRNQGWEKFTDEVILQLGQQQENKIVFVLWGKPAETKAKLISARHTIIASAHPSPLSAYRGFFGSRPFSRVNEALTQAGHAPVCWESVCKTPVAEQPA